MHALLHPTCWGVTPLSCPLQHVGLGVCRATQRVFVSRGCQENHWGCALVAAAWRAVAGGEYCTAPVSRGSGPSGRPPACSFMCRQLVGLQWGVVGFCFGSYSLAASSVGDNQQLGRVHWVGWTAHGVGSFPPAGQSQMGLCLCGHTQHYTVAGRGGLAAACRCYCTAAERGGRGRRMLRGCPAPYLCICVCCPLLSLYLSVLTTGTLAVC
jgi:hypothetical protein